MAVVSPLRIAIRFEDVWFRYGPELPWSLRGLTLTISAGAATALVGANGAGKSTVVKLLCRFYDPQRGTITWDGVDIRQFPARASCAGRITAVFQDFMTYDLSAAENIALGDLPATGEPDRAQLVAAARFAGVHDAITALQPTATRPC